MNALVLFPEDLSADGGIAFDGERAVSFIREQNPVVGQQVRVAVLRQARFMATVLEVGEQVVRLASGSPEKVLARVPLTLVMAVPRPQTVKKVISLAVQAGVDAVYFVRSHLTVPSYLQSHSLRPEDLQQEVIKALEQVWDSHPPHVEVIDRMGRFFDQQLPLLISGNGPVALFLGEPLDGRTCSLGDAMRAGPFHRAVLAIGPEKGWSASEQEGFAAAGFSLVHLGEREYRVETALAFFIGQLQILLSGSGDLRS